MKIEVTAGKSFKVSLSIIGILFLLNVAVIVAEFGFGVPPKNFFVQLLNMEYEHNLPSIWSAVQLLYASILLYSLSRLVFKENDKYKWLWALLSLAFFYLSLDEAFELHEKSMRITHDTLHTRQYLILYYSWVIPAGVAVLTMGLVYLKFVIDLPRRTQVLFIVSGAIYAGSAIIFELIQGPMDQAGDWMNLPYAILVLIEETLEMFGICLFTYAVIDYTDNRFPEKEEATVELSET